MHKYKVVYLNSLTKKEATVNDLELMELQKNPIVRIISAKRIK